MNLIELRKLVSDKLKVAPWLVMNHNDQSVKVKIDGREFLISTSLCVCSDLNRMFNPYDSDARQLEKLLRGEQWDGTGLPPVGTECEVMDKDHDHIWYRCKILAHIVRKGLPCAVFESEPSVSCCSDRYFRPLRTERDKAIEQIRKVGSSLPASVPFAIEEAAAIYDAIVAGKIDGLGKVG